MRLCLSTVFAIPFALSAQARNTPHRTKLPRDFIHQRISQQKWRALHPTPRASAVYHSARHSKNVARMVYLLAQHADLPASDATFVAEVGLLHDIDPTRTPGRPARVAATIEWLSHGEGLALVRQWGWTKRQLAMAIAMIQRTEFPFSQEVREVAAIGPAEELGAKAKQRILAHYRAISPVDRYKRYLRELSLGDRAFVLRWGATLAEYADKASWYFQVPTRVHAATRGLSLELKEDKRSGTYDFLNQIGTRRSFEIDHRIASELGLSSIQIPLLADVLQTMGSQAQHNWNANLELAKLWSGPR